MSQTSEMLSNYRDVRRRLMGSAPKSAPPVERKSVSDLVELTARYEEAIDLIAKQAKEIEHLKRSQIPRPDRMITMERIQQIIAEKFGILRIDILSDRRTLNVVLPRQIAMYLAKKLTMKSMPEIGRRFGDKDHTTVLHAVRKITNAIAMDEAWAVEVRACEQAVLDGLSNEAS